jgi:uncharacterized membrane protein YvbJ
MALTTCPDCGKEVSSQAPVCPNCGRPISASVTNANIHGSGEGIFMKGLNCGCAITIGIVVTIIVIAIIVKLNG